LAGEMSGRTEGGAKDRLLSHFSFRFARSHPESILPKQQHSPLCCQTDSTSPGQLASALSRAQY
ncbi:hypothetical protein, partial [Mesorhizobium tamadayense]|uniref:hypothetical protein n=1 Tax=Mesorhizobium tamadayense TaxID=425306 RepID=UPI001981B571